MALCCGDHGAKFSGTRRDRVRSESLPYSADSVCARTIFGQCPRARTQGPLECFPVLGRRRARRLSQCGQCSREGRGCKSRGVRAHSLFKNDWVATQGTQKAAGRAMGPTENGVGLGKGREKELAARVRDGMREGELLEWQTLRARQSKKGSARRRRETARGRRRARLPREAHAQRAPLPRAARCRRAFGRLPRRRRGGG